MKSSCRELLFASSCPSRTKSFLQAFEEAFGDSYNVQNFSSAADAGRAFSEQCFSCCLIEGSSEFVSVVGMSGLNPVISVIERDSPQEAACCLNAGAIDVLYWDELIIPSRLKDAVQLAPVRQESLTMQTALCSQRNALLSLDSFKTAVGRKKAEEALQKSEQKYRLLVEMSHDLIWSVDVDGQWTFVNKKGSELVFGCPPEEMLGKRFTEFMTQEIGERDFKVFENIKRGQPIYGYETEHIRKDGSVCTLSYNATALRDDNGKVIGTTGTARDITEKVLAHGALKDSVKRYRTLTESSPIAIWNIGLDGKTIYMNPCLQTMLELDAESPVEEVNYREIFPPYYLARVEKEKAKTLEGATSSYESQIRGRKGAVRDVIITETPLYSSAGKLKSILRMLVDTSARKHAEREKRQIEIQMQHAQKLECLGVLAGGIAHDFNNLLMGVLGNASLAELEIPPESPLTERIDRIKLSAQRASELTNQLLAYSGKGKQTVASVNLSRLVREMGNLLETVVSKRASITYALRKLPAIEADPSQINQVVMNLITNASDAVSKRGGKIAVETKLVRISEQVPVYDYFNQLIPPGDFAFLEVRDDGEGMNQQTLERLFDPFFTTKFKGRGLGLAAVAGIVRGHGGTLSVETHVGSGSKFCVYFPLATREESPKEVSNLEEDSSYQGRGTVMVVDDEETVRTVTKSMLEYFGFDVITAQDGNEAVQLFERNREDVSAILLDITMPEKTGCEAFQELRNIKSSIPIIFSSGYREEEGLKELEGSPNCSFIQKPYEPKALVRAMRSLLN